ncbi:hypothetical protein AJ78_07984 [Emergomyces pasteurianus Ep9510]|uniref:Uncharacterized protein n=1 Tax=Emergomyces pasteurianus Ep9510 TaxID=1447872 RepID=A0A1J9P4X5_9EURO|nr:hypothetical protein AJ78_07984 [Emergomyces pasteurianus Ep9510]
MATLIPISTSSQATDKGQLEYGPGEGWHSWTPEEQGGVLAASILVFLFLFGLTLFVSLRVPKRLGERRQADPERGLRERRDMRDRRREERMRGEPTLKSASQTLRGPQPRRNMYTYTSAVRGSSSQRATKRFSSDEPRNSVPDRQQRRRRESAGRPYSSYYRELTRDQRSQSCPGPRDRGPFEGREKLTGERSHWGRRRRPWESVAVCDGSDETLERRFGSDSTSSYADGDPGSSIRNGNERMSRHHRHQSEGFARIERHPRNMRSYSVG